MWMDRIGDGVDVFTLEERRTKASEMKASSQKQRSTQEG